VAEEIAFFGEFNHDLKNISMITRILIQHGFRLGVNWHEAKRIRWQVDPFLILHSSLSVFNFSLCLSAIPAVVMRIATTTSAMYTPAGIGGGSPAA
jgi:hypothetical protein